MSMVHDILLLTLYYDSAGVLACVHNVPGRPLTKHNLPIIWAMQNAPLMGATNPFDDLPLMAASCIVVRCMHAARVPLLAGRMKHIQPRSHVP